VTRFVAFDTHTAADLLITSYSAANQRITTSLDIAYSTDHRMLFKPTI